MSDTLTALNAIKRDLADAEKLVQTLRGREKELLKIYVAEQEQREDLEKKLNDAPAGTTVLTSEYLFVKQEGTKWVWFRVDNMSTNETSIGSVVAEILATGLDRCKISAFTEKE